MTGIPRFIKYTLSAALFVFCVIFAPWRPAAGVALFLLVPLLLVWFPAQINRATVNVTNPEREPGDLFGGDAFKDIPTPGWLLAALGWVILVGCAVYVVYRL